MSTEQNIGTAKKIFEEMWNGRNFENLNEHFASSFKGHDPQAAVNSPDELKAMMQGYQSAFPDLKFTIDDVFGDGDKVLLRWTGVGTHQSEMNGIPPTGKQATVKGNSVMRFENGQVVEDWTVWDALGMFQQLGLVDG